MINGYAIIRSDLILNKFTVQFEDAKQKSVDKFFNRIIEGPTKFKFNSKNEIWIFPIGCKSKIEHILVLLNFAVESFIVSSFYSKVQIVVDDDQYLIKTNDSVFSEISDFCKMDLNLEWCNSINAWTMSNQFWKLSKLIEYLKNYKLDF